MKGCNKVSVQPSLLQAKQQQLSQAFFTGEVFHPSDHPGPPLTLPQQIHVFLVLRAPELDARLQVRSHHRIMEHNRGTESPPLICWSCFSWWSPGYGCPSGLQAHVVVSRPTFHPPVTPKSVLAGLLSFPLSTSLYWYRGFPWPGCRTLHLALLNIMRFTWAQFSSLSRSLWMTSYPSGVLTAPLILVSPANLLRVHLIHCLCHWWRC